MTFVSYCVIWTASLCAIASYTCGAEPILRIVAFGDSTTDQGNIWIGSGKTYPPSPPFAGGSFTNGPIWLEYLARQWNAPVPQPSSAGGTNYAYGYADTSWSSAPEPHTGVMVPGTGKQVDMFLEHDSPRPGDLFVFLAGYNDFSRHNADPAVVANNLARQIRTLAAKGGRRFLACELTGEFDAVKHYRFTQFNRHWNAHVVTLRDELHVDIDLAPFYSIVYKMFSQGSFEPQGHAYDESTGVIQPNPNRFGCWDVHCHWTTRAHEYIARRIHDYIEIVPAPNSQTLAKVGVLGDSLSDEYEFSPWSSRAMNWMEQLVALRGLNMGERTTTPRDEPRRAGFALNWARSGDTAVQMRERQLPGILSQIDAGEVSLVFVACGSNDLARRAVEIHEGQLDGESLAALTAEIISNIRHTVEQLQAHQARVVLGTIDDIFLPPAAQEKCSAAGRERMAGIVRDVNQRIIALADERRVPVVEIQKIYELSTGPPLDVGGVAIRGSARGADPRDFWVGDGYHPGWVPQAIWANAFLEAVRIAYGAYVPLIWEDDFWQLASRTSETTAPTPPKLPIPIDASLFVHFGPEADAP